jgi:hypothetical protein
MAIFFIGWHERAIRDNSKSMGQTIDLQAKQIVQQNQIIASLQQQNQISNGAAKQYESEAEALRVSTANLSRELTDVSTQNRINLDNKLSNEFLWYVQQSEQSRPRVPSLSISPGGFNAESATSVSPSAELINITGNFAQCNLYIEQLNSLIGWIESQQSGNITSRN